MNFIKHPSNNAVLGAPDNWKNDALPVHALPVTRGDIDGQSVVVSFWRPTADEIAAIVAGRAIALVVVGGTMLPVALSVAGG
jgi:hypothetical protein